MLTGGAERGFSSLHFSPDGSRLSSVGQKPDFLLTVWDWTEERIMLHTKAFGQDVYKVAFSQDDPGRLTTSGTGHIRFWNMARTFTGLKLQGEIGKFGKIDLSDVDAFVELPDSKVVSSSETGHLLLWEGNFVKCRFVTSSAPPSLMYDKAGEELIFGDVPAHAGGIYSIIHDRDIDMIITAGADGNIKYWSFPEIDVAEVDSDITMDYPIIPQKTIPAGPEVSIKCIVDCGESYLIEDDNGSLCRQSKTATSADTKETLWEFHSGSIAGVAVSPTEHFCATGGADGKVCIWDYVSKVIVGSYKNNQSCICLAAVPTSLDETGRTFAAGFSDGVLRCFVRTEDESGISLQQVTKPHNGPVTCISYSPDGNYVVTGGQDGFVFVLKTPGSANPTDPYTPIGFVKTDDEVPVSSVSWRSDSGALLYTFGNTAVEIDVSEGLSTINANSFEMSPKMRSYQYKDRPVIKDTTEAETEGDAEADTEEKKDEGNQDDQEPVEIVPPHIAFACYTMADDANQDNFLVSFGGEKAGKLYEAKFGDEYSLGEYSAGVPTTGLLEDEEISVVKNMSYSASKKFILTAFDNGSVTVRPAADPRYFTRYTMHDGFLDGASGASLSFDDEFLITTGEDGILSIYRLNPEVVMDAALKAAADSNAGQENVEAMQFSFEDSGEGNSTPPEGFKEVFPSTKEGQEKAAATAAAATEDITSSTAYSIEDEKLRKEEDASKLAAEKKKDAVREVVKGWQKEYAELVKKNFELPEEQQLTSSELMVDAEYDEILKEQGRQMIEEVRLECMHDSEKSTVKLAKLQAAYLDILQFEPLCVHGMKNGLQVASFPTKKMTPEVLKMLDHVLNVIKGENTSGRGKTFHSSKSFRNSRQSRASKMSRSTMDISTFGLDEDGNEKKLSAFEMRKIMRIERKQAMEDLVNKKPDEDADDPRDVEAITDAIKNLGDYKIKTNEDYEVPEELQVNAEKKRQQIVLLEESIHKLKVTFNERLIKARDQKYDVFLTIKAFNDRIRSIDKQLDQVELSKNLWEPELQVSEYPDDRNTFTDDDVTAFLKKTTAAANRKCPMVKKCSKNFDVGNVKVGKTSGGGWSEEAIALANDLPVLRATFDNVTYGELPQFEKGSTLSQIEQDEVSEIKKKLKFQRATLVAKINSDVEKVDGIISQLRKDRLMLASDLSAAALRVLLKSRELHLLNEFESKDKMLTTKIEKCQRDKAEVVASISDCSAKLQTKSIDLEEWMEKDVLIMEEFKGIVPQSNGFHDQLLKIFKRKIKRTKKRNADEDNEEDEDEESDYSDYDEDDSEYEDDEVDDSCPPGCDTQLYESVIELREKRLNQEDTLNDFQKQLDELKKAHDRHIGRERQIDKDLKSSEVEIQKFQTEKQKKINELLVTIPLKMNQINLWKTELDEEGNKVEVPENPKVLRESVSINECAIFDEKKLEKLRNRIGELKEEIVVSKNSFSELHKTKRALEKDKLTRKKDIEKQAKECEEIQLLKFGQVIDIEALDKLSVNNDEAELKNKTKALEISNEQEVFSLKTNHKKLREKLLQLTKVNTEKLNQIAQLNARQFFLEKELNGKGGGMQVADDGPTVRQETEERNRLVALVKLQAKEVDALKAEINLLRRKGGHIYAPPPPPELMGGGDTMNMDGDGGYGEEEGVTAGGMEAGVVINGV